MRALLSGAGPGRQAGAATGAGTRLWCDCEARRHDVDRPEHGPTPDELCERATATVRRSEAHAQRWFAGAACKHLDLWRTAGGELIPHAVQQRNSGAAIERTVRAQRLSATAA